MKPTDKTLAEQMGIHELEIAHRKHLLGFTPQDAARLADARSHMLEVLDRIVDEFYEHQTSIDEIALIIGDAETLRRLRAAQRIYIAELFGGHYDDAYVNNRLRIGMVHKRIGVEPKYYLAAVKVLKEILRKALKNQISDRATLTQTLEALEKLLYFDTQLVFDTYIGSMLSEIEVAKDQVVRYAQRLEAKVADRTKELEALSRTDALTGLLNRRALIHDVRREIERAKRTNSVVSLIYLDLDGFKSVNDANGHHEGDETLRKVGRAISGLAREVDVAGRYGGDEFLVVLPGSDRTGAHHFVDRLRERFASTVGLAFSVGIVETGPDRFHETDEMLKIADQLMYDMKRAHRQPRNRSEHQGPARQPPSGGSRSATPGSSD